MSFQNPVIIIPGITAVDMLDDYPLSTDKIWSMIFKKDYDRIAMHPDDLRYEAREPSHVVPGRVFAIYDDLTKALRYELSSRSDRPTPVFQFAYDWRVDIHLTAQKLAEFVEEVIDRTRLLKHYDGAKNLKVDLVGHSMGGLIITEYLSQKGAGHKAGKIVTIGTPFQGSVEAIVKLTTGMSLLTGNEPKEREREAARVTPAVYQLIPSYRNVAVNETGQSVNLLKPENMQRSIVSSLTEFVRLYSVGVRSAEREDKAWGILKTLLKKAEQHRRRVNRLALPEVGVTTGDWLAIVGIGEATRVQVSVKQTRSGPRFVITEDQFVNEYNKDNLNSQRTGDGTVPLHGALPPFLPAEQLVSVVGGDLGRYELRDRVLVKAGGFHGLLPRVNLVQRLVTRHLYPDYNGDVWGRPVPGITTEWQPPINGLRQAGF